MIIGKPPTNPFGDVIEGLGRITAAAMFPAAVRLAAEREREELVREKMEMGGMNEDSAILRELLQEHRNDEENRRREELRRRLVAALTEIGEDVYLEHDVLRFRREYGGTRAGVYTYAAIKCDGRWYLTGRYGERQSNGITWSDLCEFIATGLVEYPDGSTLPQLLTAGPDARLHPLPLRLPLLTPDENVELPTQLFVDES